MEKASVLECLEGGVEVAVLAGDRTPAVLFRYEKDVRSVVRCRIVATGQLRTEKAVGWNAGLRLAARRDGIRVIPLESAPTVDGKVLSIGEQPPTENFTNITEWLVQRGFSDDDISAVLGANIVRALEGIWPA